MQRKRGNEAKVVTATLLLVIWVLALSVVSPVMSPKPSGPREKGISNNGSVRGAFGIEIYWSQQATDKVSSIDWGTFEPGSNKSVTIYIRNEGKKSLSLSFYTSGWNPSEASDCLNLNWDYGGQSISAGEIVQVTFTLSISSSGKGIETFSFDTTITGSP